MHYRIFKKGFGRSRKLKMARINLSEITPEELLLYTKYRKFFARLVQVCQRDCHYLQQRYGPKNPNKMYQDKKQKKQKVKPKKNRKYRRDQSCKRRKICRKPKRKRKPL